MTSPLMRLVVLLMLFSAGAATGWFGKGYFSEGYARRQMNVAVKDAVKQNTTDSKILSGVVNKQIKVEKDFANVPDTKLCTHGGADFLRVFNSAVSKSNTED